jgi:hypothetical protein
MQWRWMEGRPDVVSCMGRVRVEQSVGVWEEWGVYVEGVSVTFFLLKKNSIQYPKKTLAHSIAHAPRVSYIRPVRAD